MRLWRKCFSLSLVIWSVCALLLQGCFVFGVTGYYVSTPNPTVTTSPVPQISIPAYSITSSGYTVTQTSIVPSPPYSLTVNWESAQTWEVAEGSPSSPSSFLYRLVMSTHLSDVSTQESVEAMSGPGLLMDWTPNVTTYSVVGLLPSTTYYFAVLAQSQGGMEKVFYPPVSQSTQVVFAFTSCGANGSSGPQLSACNTSYAGTPLQGEVTMPGPQGVQVWTIPVTGTFLITAIGADGGADSGFEAGSGAIMQGVFDTTPSGYPQNPSSTQTQLSILVGQNGTGCTSGSGGGGGGSFVAYTANSTPLIVAGGGGGNTGFSTSLGGCPGSTLRFGTTGEVVGTQCQNSTSLWGQGGVLWDFSSAGAGAGFFGNGTSSAIASGGTSFTGGGAGGTGQNSCGMGGFGGGGAGTNAGGGGGGYTGGDGVGGGGGSLNLGLDQFNVSGVLNGGTGRNGAVLIQRLK